jgi:hypothetical protein
MLQEEIPSQEDFGRQGIYGKALPGKIAASRRLLIRLLRIPAPGIRSVQEANPASWAKRNRPGGITNAQPE